jgi:GMP synthase-like glutamine amidotransferase
VPDSAARLLVVVPSETDPPARLGEWLRQAGLELDERLLGRDELPADLTGHDGLLVLGGPQSSVDGFPELDPVRDLLRRAIERDVPTLAVCLGGQLLAQAGGGAARIAVDGPEVGASLVAKRDSADADPVFGPLPLSPDVLQWHHDEISQLPPAATLLASSPRYPHQAFRVGRHVYGLQFHIETTSEMVRSWAEEDPVGVASTPFDVDTICARFDAVADDLAEAWQPFAARFADLVRSRAHQAA